MSDLESQIEQLKKKAESARAAQYRAEAARESAQRSKDEALAILQERFGLDDLGDARVKLAELEDQLQTKVAEATAILDANQL